MSTHIVWKYSVPFPGPDQFSIDMPAGAELLTIQLQFNEPQMWALVNPTSPTTTRHFRLAGTGHPIDDDVSGYVGTFQIAGGSLVFHVLEVQS